MLRRNMIVVVAALTTASVWAASTTQDQGSASCSSGASSCCKDTQDEGCCAEGKGGCAAGEDVAALSQRDGQVQVLKDSLLPVIEHFNASRERAQVVALLSPTCAGCVHAARALKAELAVKRPEAKLVVTIVWVPMLRSDNERTARRAAGLFEDARVTQYYDPARLSGVAYARDVFSPQAARALSGELATGLPSLWLETLASEPARAPIWDAVFFYDRGSRWGERVPAPATWSKQTCFHAPSGDDGVTGTFAIDGLTKKAQGSDWFLEVGRGVALLLAHDRASEAQVPSSSRPGASSAGGE